MTTIERIEMKTPICPMCGKPMELEVFYENFGYWVGRYNHCGWSSPDCPMGTREEAIAEATKIANMRYSDDNFSRKSPE